MVKKSGLGRGLSALMSETTLETRALQDGTDTQIPLDRIRVNPDQPRRTFNEDELVELADSIRANGILQPLVVRPWQGAYQIVAGERRYQAAMRAGLTSVPAVVREVSDADLLRLALIENLQRSDLNPLEAARGYAQLMRDENLSQAEVAQVVSKSRPAVANALRLLELPESVQTMLMDGKLSAGHARALLAARDEEAMNVLAQRVVDEGLSVRQTETLASLVFVNEPSAGKTSAEGTEHRSSAVPVERFSEAALALSNGLETRVRVRTVRGKNKIEIEFSDEEELDELVRRMIGVEHEDL